MRSRYRRARIPEPHEPRPSPTMNAERTIETSAVVTPNWAMARRTHTISYRMLQKPETKKNPKYHRIGESAPEICCVVNGCSGARLDSRARRSLVMELHLHQFAVLVRHLKHSARLQAHEARDKHLRDLADARVVGVDVVVEELAPVGDALF